MSANVERSETYAMSTVSAAMHLPQPYIAIAAEIFAVHVFSGSMIVAEYGIVSLVRTVRARDESESVSPFNILFLSAFFEYTFPSSTTLQYRAVTRPLHSRYGCMTSLVRQGSARPGTIISVSMPTAMELSGCRYATGDTLTMVPVRVAAHPTANAASIYPASNRICLGVVMVHGHLEQI